MNELNELDFEITNTFISSNIHTKESSTSIKQSTIEKENLEEWLDDILG